MNKNQSIECLRTAIQATMLVCPQHGYRVWAKGYLQRTMPITDTGDLLERANDAIAVLEGYQPWTGPGRAKECWFAIRGVCMALSAYADEEWGQVGKQAKLAVEVCLEINDKSGSYLNEYQQIVNNCVEE